MTDELFNFLWKSALSSTDKEAFVSLVREGGIMQEINPSDECAVAFIEKLYYAAHVNIKELAKSNGYTLASFSTKYCIPYRTLQGWVLDEARCPTYFRLALVKDLGFLPILSEKQSAEEDSIT